MAHNDIDVYASEIEFSKMAHNDVDLKDHITPDVISDTC